MSLSSAKMALQLALDDAKQKPRTLLIVTGQGKHSTGEPLLKEGVASMLDKLQLHARAVAGGFYVQTWRGKRPKKILILMADRTDSFAGTTLTQITQPLCKWLLMIIVKCRFVVIYTLLYFIVVSSIQANHWQISNMCCTLLQDDISSDLNIFQQPHTTAQILFIGAGKFFGFTNDVETPSQHAVFSGSTRK